MANNPIKLPRKWVNRFIVVPSITLIFCKMTFFDILLWKNSSFDSHEIFRVSLSYKGLLLFKIELENRYFRRSLYFYIVDAGKKWGVSGCWHYIVNAGKNKKMGCGHCALMYIPTIYLKTGVTENLLPDAT